MIATWQASTAYLPGTVVAGVTTPGTGFYFRCIRGGTSGAAEPVWPTAIANTTLDGTVEWMAVSIIAGNCQTMTPGSIIEMFQLELNSVQHGLTETYYFHAGANMDGYGELVWAGQNYLRFPVQADGFEYNGKGSLPRPKVRISNATGAITTILLGLPNGLEGAKVTRVRTLARYLDAANFEGGVNPYGTPDPTAEFPREIYYIDRKSNENREIVEFELAAAFDIAGVRAPKRQCIGNICQWVYRSAECSYAGTNYFNIGDEPVLDPELDQCGKRLSSCRARFGATAELPYGSFPGIGSNVG